MAGCPGPETIQAYVDRQMTGVEAALVAAHLQLCPCCRRIHDWLLFISQTLSARTQPVAPERLQASIRQAIDSAKPIPRISCKRAADLICSYVDGELASAEELLLWRHVFTCAQCYLELKQTEEIAGALRRQAAPVLTPDGLPQRVYRAVEAERTHQEISAIRPQRWPISWRKTAAAGAGLAAAAALVVGLLLGPQPPGLDESEFAEVPPVVPVTEPAVEPIQPEVAVVEQPEIAGPQAPTAKPVVRPRRTTRSRSAAAVRATKPKPLPDNAEVATDRPEPSVREEGTTVVAVGPVPVPSPRHPEPPAISDPGHSPGGPELVAVSPNTRPTAPVTPTTSPGEGPRLALVRYTPVASSSETLYSSSGGVAESALSAAAREINKHADFNQRYAARPNIELKKPW